jgi:DNA helicase IV
LYYEYKEGDEYFEIIQGNEREGTILSRIGVDIKSGKLLRISTSLATYEKKQGVWEASSGARAGSSAGTLQDIADLITPEQFGAITENSKTAVLIQGIAGSGKTTVAFHRLSWLLKHDEAEIFSDACLVLVRSKALAQYCSQILPTMGIDEVPVFTFDTWLLENAKKLCPAVLEQGRFRPCSSPTPSSLIRMKGSADFLQALENAANATPSRAKTASELLSEFYPLLDKIFSQAGAAEKNIRSGFGDKDLAALGKMRNEENAEFQVLDPMDRCLFLRLIQIRFGGLPLPSGGIGKLDHIVVDEVQDFSSLELAVIVDSVKETSQLTLVGDAAQEIHGTSEFPGWDELRRRWKLGSEYSQYFSLTVSHRSTLPIMRLADAVQGRNTVTDGKAGRTPLWMHAKNETFALRSAIAWLKQATERYPSALTAAICKDQESAKYLHGLLAPSFGALVRLGDDRDFQFDAGLVVTTIQHAKGLEFANVLLWDVSEKNYPYDKIGQNMLYVGITRACENVCLMTWKTSSPCLPPRTSGVVRFVGVGVEEA